MPYPRHRAALAALTGWAPRHLWPGIDALDKAAPDTGDILMTYARALLGAIGDLAEAVRRR